MKRARPLAWLLFLVFAVWCHAVQGWIAGGSSAPRWIPEIGLVFALSLLVHLEIADVPVWVLLTAWSRASIGTEPGVVLLAGFAAIAVLAVAARSVLELSTPLWRAATCGALAFVLDAWLAGAGALRGTALASAGAPAMLAAWSVALSSAAFALVMGVPFSRMPGLAPLRSRRW